MLRTRRVGFHTTFLVQHVLGANGMPRRYADYPYEFSTLNLMSSVGAKNSSHSAPKVLAELRDFHELVGAARGVAEPGLRVLLTGFAWP
ncbi:hypothetical protein E1264_12845 [Actinomadura sp. KC216]|nr:hypothetical protein E1264_12845 [Actinomadura sp. KC216]